MLSICTTLKNRTIIKFKEETLEPFPTFLKSINKITEDIELVVSDFNSKDAPIQETLEKYLTNIPYKVVDLGNDPFSLMRGLNSSYESSSGDDLLFVDADIIVKNKAIKMGIERLRDSKTYFPIVYGFSALNTKKGLWCIHDFKTLMITKETFEKTTKWQESDDKGKIFHRNCRRYVPSNNLIREKDRGFLHLWHPKTNKNIWTKRR